MRSTIIRLDITEEDARSAGILEVLLDKLCDKEYVDFYQDSFGSRNATNPCRTDASACARRRGAWFRTPSEFEYHYHLQIYPM